MQKGCMSDKIHRNSLARVGSLDKVVSLKAEKAVNASFTRWSLWGTAASHDALESKETFPQDQIANEADIKRWIQLDTELQLVQIDSS